MSRPARFRVLPGLPATGPLPEQFSDSGQGKHREGFVVEFEPSDGASWIGNFQPGYAQGYSQVILHPDGQRLLVIAGGTAYVVDPETRELIATFGGGVEIVLADEERHQLIIGNGLWFEAVTASGMRWRSRRLSWDGIQNVRIDGSALRGEAWNLSDWSEFTVDLQTGDVVGSSYNGPD